MCFSPICCALRPGHVPTNDQVCSSKVPPDDHVLDRLAETGHFHGVRQATSCRSSHPALSLDERRPVNVTGLRGPACAMDEDHGVGHILLGLHQTRSAQRRHCCFGCDSARNGEAAHLGDLMWLWVRSRVQVNLSFGFSRTPRMSRCLTSRLTLSPGKLFSV